MNTTTLARQFKAKIEGKEVSLPDPNPAMSVEEVLEHYSAAYPTLHTAIIDGDPQIEGDIATYTFKDNFGPKG